MIFGVLTARLSGFSLLYFLAQKPRSATFPSHQKELIRKSISLDKMCIIDMTVRNIATLK